MYQTQPWIQRVLVVRVGPNAVEGDENVVFVILNCFHEMLAKRYFHLTDFTLTGLVNILFVIIL